MLLCIEILNIDSIVSVFSLKLGSSLLVNFIKLSNAIFMIWDLLFWSIFHHVIATELSNSLNTSSLLLMLYWNQTISLRNNYLGLLSNHRSMLFPSSSWIPTKFSSSMSFSISNLISLECLLNKLITFIAPIERPCPETTLKLILRCSSHLASSCLFSNKVVHRPTSAWTIHA